MCLLVLGIFVFPLSLLPQYSPLSVVEAHDCLLQNQSVQEPLFTKFQSVEGCETMDNALGDGATFDRNLGYICLFVTGASAYGNVYYKLTDPNRTVVVDETVKADGEGVAVLRYDFPPDALCGEYAFFAKRKGGGLLFGDSGNTVYFELINCGVSPPHDTEAPSVWFVAPAHEEGEYHVGHNEEITLNVQATDNSGVVRVEFYRRDYDNDTWPKIGTSTSAPQREGFYQITFNSRDLKEGRNNIHATAYDAAGNSSERARIKIYRKTVYEYDMRFVRSHPQGDNNPIHVPQHGEASAWVEFAWLGHGSAPAAADMALYLRKDPNGFSSPLPRNMPSGLEHLHGKGSYFYHTSWQSSPSHIANGFFRVGDCVRNGEDQGNPVYRCTFLLHGNGCSVESCRDDRERINRNTNKLLPEEFYREDFGVYNTKIDRWMTADTGVGANPEGFVNAWFSIVIDPSPAPETATPSDRVSGIEPIVIGDHCFAETSYCMGERINRYWQQQGGLPVFGYPITHQCSAKIEGQFYEIQWFERNRLELHPENPAPYDVLLGRLGVDVLESQGRDWRDFPKTEPRQNCLYFEETQHNICGRILRTWRANGLEIDGQTGKSVAENLALFGLPISDEVTEVIQGQEYTVQWFERARFELHEEHHPPYDVLLGLLGNEIQPGSDIGEQPSHSPPENLSPGSEVAGDEPSSPSLTESCELAGIIRRGFGLLWNNNLAVQEAVGCPTRAEVGGAFVVQYYPHGMLYWWGDEQAIYVFLGDEAGYWERFYERDLAKNDPSYACPSGTYQPVRGFGNLLAAHPDIADALGKCATTPEEPDMPGDGALQPYEHGVMLFATATQSIQEKRIWVLSNDGTFTRHKDAFPY